MEPLSDREENAGNESGWQEPGAATCGSDAGASRRQPTHAGDQEGDSEQGASASWVFSPALKR